MKLFLFSLVCLLGSTSVQAQTIPTFRSNGTGAISFEFTSTAMSELTGDVFRGQIDAAKPLDVVPVCGPLADAPTTLECFYPLAVHGLVKPAVYQLIVQRVQKTAEAETVYTADPILIDLVRPGAKPGKVIVRPSKAAK